MSRPTTPVRPPRSERRLTQESIHTTTNTTATTANDESVVIPPIPSSLITSSSSIKAQNDDEPQILPSTPKLSNRKSTCSIRRKPVPHSDELTPEYTSSSSSTSKVTEQSVPSSSTISSIDAEPPRYLLPVDPPVLSSTPNAPFPTAGGQDEDHRGDSVDFSASRPPSYIHQNNHDIHHHAEHFDPTLGLGEGNADRGLRSTDELPRYAEETQTEPKTLARALWKWGFLCPLLWLIGMCILWIPLKPIEEEGDPEKAQKLEEMIVILRKTELKYAKRCAWACLGFSVFLIAIIVIGTVLSVRL
ncbi:uncharacterized protein IL334_007831 [Kwoniella shivajii]|uniref:Serine-rich protein n=1 Tax=Kwoniella shivajii TaxID=564305 RepID=A0ABZ1DB56_9TREE|nr:hypothetical protein IL334_007831 [Kwoniella shivajii]